MATCMTIHLLHRVMLKVTKPATEMVTSKSVYWRRQSPENPCGAFAANTLYPRKFWGVLQRENGFPQFGLPGDWQKKKKL